MPYYNTLHALLFGLGIRFELGALPWFPLSFSEVRVDQTGMTISAGRLRRLTKDVQGPKIRLPLSDLIKKYLLE